jgi:small conductance mechanosensitive channel
MQDSMATIEHVKATVLDLAIRFGPRLLVAILILIVGVFVGRGVSRWTARGLGNVELEPPVRQLLARIAWLITMILFVILALQNLGVELLPLIAGLGVVGAGLALATQGVLSNVVAGLSIIFTKPFRVGEYISIVKEEGTVELITLFNTTLSHLDKSRVVIPNRKITGEILHNFGKIRQLELSVAVAYDTDMGAALGLIDEVLRNNSRVLREPAPVVGTAQLGAWSVVIAIKTWV